MYYHQVSSPGPLVVVLQGSGLRPLFEIDGERFRSSLLFFELARKADELPYHMVFIERRGLRSFQPPASAPPMSDRFGGIHKSVRVQEVVDTVEAFNALSWVSEINLAGHSEGADIAAAVSRRLPDKVSALALFAGPGPSRFFDFLMEARQSANSQAVVDILGEEIELAGREQEGIYRGAPISMRRAMPSNPPVWRI